jgi:hypothetical protein
MNEETKHCPKCKTSKSEAAFNKRGSALSSYCRACQSLYARRHYVENKTSYASRRLKWQRTYYLRNRAFALEFLRRSKCIDCGIDDPVVLEFDHIDHTTKEFNISDMIRQGFSLKRLDAEISRCEVRCVNCHRRRTAKQFHWDVNEA